MLVLLLLLVRASFSRSKKQKELADVMLRPASGGCTRKPVLNFTSTFYATWTCHVSTDARGAIHRQQLASCIAMAAHCCRRRSVGRRGRAARAEQGAGEKAAAGNRSLAQNRYRIRRSRPPPLLPNHSSTSVAHPSYQIQTSPTSRESSTPSRACTTLRSWPAETRHQPRSAILTHCCRRRTVQNTRDRDHDRHRDSKT